VVRRALGLYQGIITNFMRELRKTTKRLSKNSQSLCRVSKQVRRECVAGVLTAANLWS
jgi:hypothetical protein